MTHKEAPGVKCPLHLYESPYHNCLRSDPGIAPCEFTAGAADLFAGRHIAVPGKADALPDIRQQEILQAHDSYAVFIPLRKAIQRNHIFGIVIGTLQQIVRLAG